MPHKTTLPDGRTCYYNGVSVFPMLILYPDGTHLEGLGFNLNDPATIAAIVKADKAVSA